jgi:DNA-binding transcriptional ArsR family regulator
MESFTAIADPVRRAIIERLASGDKTAGQLGSGFQITQPAVSKHLRVLREAGLVVSITKSRHRMYRLNPAALTEVGDWLGRCRDRWEQRAGSLNAYVERQGVLTRIPVRYPGRVSLDLAGWDTGRWRTMPLRVAIPIDETAA